MSGARRAPRSTVTRAVTEPPPAAAVPDARYYSLRRLSPYQGTVQVVELPGFRAMSADGITWTVQMPNEGSRFATHALWRADGSGTLVEDERTHASIEALRAHPPFPFPLADRLELWLLDDKESLPLAILASTLPRKTPPRVTHTGWRASLKGDQNFVATRYTALGVPGDDTPHVDLLEQRIQDTAGATPRAQWFLRAADGSGQGLNGLDLDTAFEGRRFPPEQFPELLLREHWDNRADSYLVRDYHDWQAPKLLTHGNLTRATRDRLERAACRQAEALYRMRHLLPEVVNPDILQVAMVEAVIRRAG